MGRLLSKHGNLPSPKLAGPAEKDRVPDRLRINGKIPTWQEATERFTGLIEQFEQQEVTVHQALNYQPYTRKWASAAWSELYAIDEIACEWAETTVLIVFSGSYWLDKDSMTFFPPVTYIDRLQSSKQARQKALSRVLRDIEKWRTIRVIGGSGYNGYPRVFLGLYLSDAVQEEDFEPVVRAHVNNSPVAESDGHKIEKMVSIREQPQHKSQLVRGLGKRVPALNSKMIALEDWEKQKVATALHGGRWESYSFGHSVETH